MRITAISKLALLALVTSLSSPVLASVAGAAPECRSNVTVSDLGDDGGKHQLRAGIAEACEGATIRIVPGTIALQQGEVVIDRNVTLRGLGPNANPTTIDAQGSSRVLTISGQNVTLENLTVTGGFVAGGQSGAGIMNLDGNLLLRDVVVRDNTVAVPADLTAPGSTGGGIVNIANGAGASASVALVGASRLVGNFAGREGGGMLSIGVFGGAASVTVSDSSSVDGNTAQLRGGGVANFGIFSGTATLTLTGDSQVTGNTALGSVAPPIPGQGGGIFNGALLGGSAAVIGASGTVFGNTPDDCFGC